MKSCRRTFCCVPGLFCCSPCRAIKQSQYLRFTSALLGASEQSDGIRSPTGISVALDVYELLQDVLHFNEIPRVLHHFIDVFIRRRNRAVLSNDGTRCLPSPGSGPPDEHAIAACYDPIDASLAHDGNDRNDGPLSRQQPAHADQQPWRVQLTARMSRHFRKCRDRGGDLDRGRLHRDGLSARYV